MNIFRKHAKLISVTVLVAVILSSIVLAVNVFNPSKAKACRDQGCNTCFWRSHTDKWVGHNPNDLLRTLFSKADNYNIGDTTLLNTLAFNFSSRCFTTRGLAARALVREGVAARLNVSNPEIDYHISGSQVTAMVNDALASGNAWRMYRTARTLSGYNNAGCPFCQTSDPGFHH